MKILTKVIDFLSGVNLVKFIRKSIGSGTGAAVAVIGGLVGSVVVAVNFITFDWNSIFPVLLGAGMVFFWGGIIKGSKEVL